jgi:hypothetical protein
VNQGGQSIKQDNIFDEDDLLPRFSSQLAKELPQGCLYCQVRDAGDMFLMESE